MYVPVKGVSNLVLRPTKVGVRNLQIRSFGGVSKLENRSVVGFSN